MGMIETLLKNQERSQTVQSTTTTSTTESGIAEQYTLSHEELRSIYQASSGPGNFAAHLTSRLFPELFGASQLKHEFNWKGGGKNHKKPLYPPSGRMWLNITSVCSIQKPWRKMCGGTVLCLRLTNFFAARVERRDEWGEMRAHLPTSTGTWWTCTACFPRLTPHATRLRLHLCRFWTTTCEYFYFYWM